MSNYQQKPNSGAAFKNDKKEKEIQPDYKGKINVEGKDYNIAMWVKESKAGQKFFSISVSDIQTQSKPKENPPF